MSDRDKAEILEAIDDLRRGLKHVVEELKKMDRKLDEIRNQRR